MPTPSVSSASEAGCWSSSFRAAPLEAVLQQDWCWCRRAANARTIPARQFSCAALLCQHTGEPWPPRQTQQPNRRKSVSTFKQLCNRFSNLAGFGAKFSSRLFSVPSDRSCVLWQPVTLPPILPHHTVPFSIAFSGPCQSSACRSSTLALPARICTDHCSSCL